MPAGSTTSSKESEDPECPEQGLPEIRRWTRCQKAIWLGIGLFLIFLWGESWRHRFDTESVNLLEGTEFEVSSSKHWPIDVGASAQDISFADGVAKLVKRKGKASPRTSQWVDLTPDQRFLRIRAEVSVEGVYQINPGWQAPRIQFAGATKTGKPRQRKPHACGTFLGTLDWRTVDHFIELRPDDERIQISLQNWATAGTYRIRNLELRPARQQATFILRNCLIGGALLVWLIFPWARRSGWIRAGLSAAGILFLCFYTIHPRFHELDVNLFGQSYPEPPPIESGASPSDIEPTKPQPPKTSPAPKVNKQKTPPKDEPKSPQAPKRESSPKDKVPNAEAPAPPPPPLSKAPKVAPSSSEVPKKEAETKRSADWLSKFDVHREYTQFWVYGGMALIACWVAGTWYPGLILCFVVFFAEVRQALLLYPATSDDAIELGGSILSIALGVLLARYLDCLTLSVLRRFRAWRKPTEAATNEEG